MGDYYTQERTSCAFGFTPKLSLEYQLDTESVFISSCQLNMSGTSPASSHLVATSSPSLVASLPPEILIRIFHLVLPQACNLRLLYHNKKDCPRYPDYLAQVCTLWRRIVISSCALWSHIDLSPYEPRSDGLVTRAEIHAARAATLPLELHIAVDDDWRHEYNEYNELFRLIPLIADRVKTLELTMVGPFRGFHRGIFKLLLCQRLILTKLVIRSERGYYNNFLAVDTIDFPGPEANFWLLVINATEDEIESTFAPLTILHLQGIFPLWSSKAYHSLVDLRLFSTEQWSHIREAQLLAILRSSPGLKILHFGLEIYDTTPVTQEVIPVYLQDIQVLKIFPDSGRGTTMCPGSVLRLLAPGMKDLRLSFEGFYVQGINVVLELERFFARSKVASFYTRFVFPPMSLLLHHSAQLGKVVLDDFESSPHDEFPSTWLEVDRLASLPRLKSMYITRSALFESELRLLLECCPANIVLNSCSVYYDSGDEYHTLKRLEAFHLLEKFPTLKTTNHVFYPLENPTCDWDILD